MLNHKEWLSKPLVWGIFYKKPTALTASEWEQWEKLCSEKFPIQFLFRELIASFFYVLIAKLKNKWFYLKCKYITKPHVIKLRNVPPTNCFDTDVLIEAALEQLFLDFIAKNNLFANYTEEEQKDPAYIKNKEAIDSIVNFFKKEKLELQAQIATLYGELIDHTEGKLSNFLDKDAKASNISNEIQELENKLYIRESETFAKIIIYRNILWN